MARCPTCQEEVESDWLVCAYCGTRLSRSAPQQIRRSHNPTLWLAIAGAIVFLTGVILVSTFVLRGGVLISRHTTAPQAAVEEDPQVLQDTNKPVTDYTQAAPTYTVVPPAPALKQPAGFSPGFANQAYVWGKGKITRAIFSSDAGRIAVGSSTGIEVLDSQTLTTLFFLPTSAEVIDIALSSDGRIAGASLSNSTLIAIDAQTGEQINQWTLDYSLNVNQLLITPDGSRLIGYTGYNLYAWDLKGKEARLIDGGMFAPNAQDYSMSGSGEQFSIGSYFGSTSRGGMSERWQNYLPLGILFTDSGPVLLRSSDMTGRNEILVVYFDELKQTEIRYQPGDAKEHFVLSPDSQTLVGYDRRQITLWNTQTGERLQSYTNEWGDILDMRFDSQNQLWGASQDDIGVYSWKLENLQNPQLLVWPVANKDSTVKLFFMSGTDSEIIMTTQNETIDLVDFKTNTLLNHIKGSMAIGVFPDGSLLAFAVDKYLHLDPRTGKVVGTVTPCGYEIPLFISVLSGQNMICPPIQAGELQIWDLLANKVHATLPMPNPVVSVLSPLGNLILMTGDSDWQILETATGKVRTHLPGFPVYSPTPVFSADERYLVVRTSDTQFTIFDSSTGQPVGPANTVSGMISAYDFSPDSLFLAVGDHSGSVNLWRLGENAPFFTYQPHQDGINELKVSPDGHYVATSSFDGTIIIWNVAP